MISACRGTASIAPTFGSDRTSTGPVTGKAATTYACKSTDDLAAAFTPIATVPATVTTGDTGDATFTVDASVARRFYLVDVSP